LLSVRSCQAETFELTIALMAFQAMFIPADFSQRVALVELGSMPKVSDDADADLEIGYDDVAEHRVDLVRQTWNAARTSSSRWPWMPSVPAAT